MAWHDPPPMAALQQLSPVFPIGSRINEAGNLEIGGCDTLELPHEFGTPPHAVPAEDLAAPPTSSPRRTCAPARGRSSRRLPPAPTTTRWSSHPRRSPARP